MPDAEPALSLRPAASIVLVAFDTLQPTRTENDAWVCGLLQYGYTLTRGAGAIAKVRCALEL